MQEPVSLPFAPGAAWHRVDRTALVTALCETETLIRRAQAAQGEILAEMQSRGVPQTFGYADVEAVVKDVIHCDRPEARARVRRALACNEFSEGTRRVPASAPATAAAYAEGTMSARHIDSILRTLAEIPGTVPEEERLGYEKILADLARESPPAHPHQRMEHPHDRRQQTRLHPTTMAGRQPTTTPQPHPQPHRSRHRLITGTPRCCCR